MPNKTIYVKDGEMWERAKKLAGKEGLSSVIGDAIAEYVKKKEKEEQGIKKFRLEVGFAESLTSYGSTSRITFDGYLLYEKELPFFDEADRADDPNNCPVHPEIVSVYKTVGGKLILTTKDDNGITNYSVHTNFFKLAQDPILSSALKPDLATFLDAVSEKIGEDWAIRIE